jgi:hypothetical protein
MSNRTAKFLSALFVSLLAGATFTTTSQGAADDCLSGPKDKTPDGSHWYYRIDRATKRHCWYLRGEDGKPLQIVAPPPPLSARAALPNAEATMQRSIADARAALPPQTRVKQDIKQENDLATGPQISAPVPNNAGIANNQPPAARDANMLSSVIASRWPGEPSANPATDPVPDRGDRAAPSNSTLQAQTPTVLPARQSSVSDPLPQTSAYSLSARLAVLMAALALAGIVASVALKPGGSRQPRRARVRVRRGPIWEPTDDDRIVLSALPEADVPSRQAGRARGDRDARIADFFSRLSRRAPARGRAISPADAANPARTSSNPYGVRASAARPSGSTALRQTPHRYRD